MTNENKENQKRQDELIEELIARNGHGREAILGRNGLVARLRQRVVEKALAGELTHHLQTVGLNLNGKSVFKSNTA
ncbi:MAG: hypothetical protein ACREFE_14800 [Limisphaerales bacterium]